MSRRHYDAVVLGRSLGSLTAGALLARRDLRVLLLGQGQRPASYRFGGRLLRRRSFTLLFGSSPAWLRVLHELAQTQTFRRHVEPLDPMLGIVAPGRRFELPPNHEIFAREMDREFPEVRQIVDELYTRLTEANLAIDAAFDRDVVLPPGTLWERLETGRATSELSRIASPESDLLAKFPPGHSWRQMTALPAIFASDLDVAGGSFPPLALARLHGSWARGVLTLGGGEDELESFLVERIVSHGGECRLEESAESIVVRGGSVAGVVIDGDDEPTGADSVVADLSGEKLADLAHGEGITKAARDDWPRLTPTAGRFVVSVVVKTAGLPEPLAREAILVPKNTGRADPRRPLVRVQRVSDAQRPDSGETLLVAEMLLPTRGPLTLPEAREAVLGALREHLPFLMDHVVLIDSTHDGLPLVDRSTGAEREVDRIHVEGASPGAEPMQWLWSFSPLGYLDVAGEPVRGPIPGTLLVGSTVLPGLGQEGRLLAAWAAARILTRSDRRRQKMRRQLWTKIETG